LIPTQFQLAIRIALAAAIGAVLWLTALAVPGCAADPPAGQRAQLRRRTIEAARSSVARIYDASRSCSAVCVTPDGMLLSVGHCGTPTHAEFAGETWRIKVLGRSDDPVEACLVLRLLDVEGPLPYAAIAKAAPARGDPVFSWGFPHGKLVLRRGKAVGTAPFRMRGGRRTQPILLADMRLRPGHSGGPLFNAQGEVVGLSSFTLPVAGEQYHSAKRAKLVAEIRDGYGSGWVHTTTIRKARRAKYVRRVQGRRSLRVFGFAGCPGCDAFKRDHEAGKFAGWDVEYYEVARQANGRWVETSGMKLYRSLVAALEKATGRKQPAGFPAFHLAGSDRLIVGYRTRNGVDRLVGHLKETLRLPVTVWEAMETIFGRRRKESSPLPEIDSPPATDSGRAEVSPAPEPAPEEEHPLWPYITGGLAWIVKRWHERSA